MSKPNGAGDHWHISINHFHQGTIFKRDGEWVGDLNSRSELTTVDIGILGEMIDERTTMQG